ncbi:MAG: SufS family cysteine desulfurase [Planctomycetota bacterium]
MKPAGDLLKGGRRGARRTALDVERVRRDFPILHQKVHGKPLVYLDNAASTQKPSQVIDAISRFYSNDYANVHRGVHELGERATARYEAGRERTCRFLNAADSREIIFVRGATEGINLVARSFAEPRLEAGDEILITEMEHHSNIVPWQILCGEKGAALRVIPIDDSGELILDELDRLLTRRTRLVAVTQASNALGTINDVARIIRSAHRIGVPVLIDGAQGAPHLAIDVQALDCDFLVFSGHKAYGPSGVGVVYGRRELLEEMRPYQVGGEMIRRVTFEGTEYNDLPWRFEAGTPNVAGVVGLGAAIDYLESVGADAVAAHEAELLARATEAVLSVPGARLIGKARERTPVLSFILEGIHPHDIGTILDREGIAIRAGHHCAQPVMERFGVPATVRASFGLYNKLEEIDMLVRGLRRVKEFFH